MREIALLSKKPISKEEFCSKIGKYKNNKDEIIFKLNDDQCYISFNDIKYSKGTDEYKEYAMGLWALIDDEEEDWKKISFPFDPFYSSVEIEYHFSLDILKSLLEPFKDLEIIVLTNECQFVPIKEYLSKDIQ